MSANRRQFARIAFHSPAELTTGDGHDDVTVLDLSLKGALVRLPAGARARVGENCALRVRLGEPESSIRMQGTLVHIEGIYAGLACRNIDLDSVTHLRRVVELNLGDPALLERELGALVAE